MQIPGHIDPVPVPRPHFESDDPRVDLVGLSRDAIRDALVEAGLSESRRSFAPSRSGTRSTIAAPRASMR
jgi:hypothetical protein